MWFHTLYGHLDVIKHFISLSDHFVHLSDEKEVLYNDIMLALIFHCRSDCSNLTNASFEEGQADCMTSLLLQIMFCMRYHMSLPDR
jgi:hypothetical protein